MASVTIGQVQKYFGQTHIIKGVSVDIADGEFCVLVGPSGCGKSTLLRMIAGLEEISGGEVKIGAKVVNDMPPKERDIAMVFQNYALYPHMTVRANMAFSLMLAKKDKATIEVASAKRPTFSVCVRCWTVTRASYPAASASVWRWAAPSCATRRCFCSTSRCLTSTRNCGWRCAPRSRSCTSV